MDHKHDALNQRTKGFAIRVCRFAKYLEPLPVVRWLAKQLVRASTSVAANQRAARRARSDRELAAKLSIVVEESDESALWLEILQELDLPATLTPELDSLTSEAQQLMRMYAKGRATVRDRIERAKEKAKKERRRKKP